MLQASSDPPCWTDDESHHLCAYGERKDKEEAKCEDICKALKKSITQLHSVLMESFEETKQKYKTFAKEYLSDQNKTIRKLLELIPQKLANMRLQQSALLTHIEIALERWKEEMDLKTQEEIAAFANSAFDLIQCVRETVRDIYDGILELFDPNKTQLIITNWLCKNQEVPVLQEQIKQAKKWAKADMACYMALGLSPSAAAVLISGLVSLSLPVGLMLCVAGLVVGVALCTSKYLGDQWALREKESALQEILEANNVFSKPPWIPMGEEPFDLEEMRKSLLKERRKFFDAVHCLWGREEKQVEKQSHCVVCWKRVMHEKVQCPSKTNHIFHQNCYEREHSSSIILMCCYVCTAFQ